MNDETIPATDPTPEEEPTIVEAEAQAEATAETTSSPETQKTLPPLTAERVTDIAFGLGKAAVDVLDQAARQLDDTVRQIRQDAPGFIAEMEEKGRPVREKLSENIKSFNINDVFKKATAPGDSPASDPNAFDDIEALENRVRELEQQVTSEPVAETPPPAPTEVASPFSMLELDDEPPVAVAVEEPAAPKKPAARRTKKKPEGETSAE
jgi:polyhydroxyalkanoate synthesis regulator phasin